MHGHDRQQSPPDSHSSFLSSFYHKTHEKQQANYASTRLVRQEMRQRDDIAGVPLRLVPDALIEAIHPLRQAQAACLATACRVSGRLAGHSIAAMAALCRRCRWALLADSRLCTTQFACSFQMSGGKHNIKRITLGRREHWVAEDTGAKTPAGDCLGAGGMFS